MRGRGVPLALSYAFLRGFHGRAQGTMVATGSLRTELAGRGFRNLLPWSRGVDLHRFRPGDREDWPWPRPIFLYVGRLAVEKNVARFLALDLPGTKVVVGDGPQRAALRGGVSGGQVRRRAAWRRADAGPMPAPTCSCSRRAPTRSAWCCWRAWPAARRSRRCR